MGDVEKGYYFVPSPPALVRGKLVLGGWVTDGQHVGEPSGVVRAYDVVAGAFSWAFDAVQPGCPGVPPEGQAVTTGTTTSWAHLHPSRGRSSAGGRCVKNGYDKR